MSVHWNNTWRHLINNKIVAQYFENMCSDIRSWCTPQKAGTTTVQTWICAPIVIYQFMQQNYFKHILKRLHVNIDGLVQPISYANVILSTQCHHNINKNYNKGPARLIYDQNLTQMYSGITDYTYSPGTVEEALWCHHWRYRARNLMGLCT